MAHKITQSCIGCTACAKSCPALAIKGENKELHVIDPHCCVDCSVCGMTCPVGSVLDPGGEPVAKVAPAKRPKPVVNPGLCTACELCIDICRFQALELSKPGAKGDIKAWAIPIIKNCVSCGLCKKVCPVDAITMEVKASEAS